MPDKPLWLARIPDAIQELESATEPWVERSHLEALLGIGRRRAQQLLAPLATHRVGASLLAHREDLIAHLRRVASGEQAEYDDRRRKRLWNQLGAARSEWIDRPPVLVEVPNSDLRRLQSQDFDGLPEGVNLAPGAITIQFSTPDEALQKLLALAVAVSHNRDAFDQRVSLGNG